jgi:hypothetical protein
MEITWFEVTSRRNPDFSSMIFSEWSGGNVTLKTDPTETSSLLVIPPFTASALTTYIMNVRATLADNSGSA